MHWKTLAAAGLTLAVSGTAQAGPIGSQTYNGAIFSIELLGNAGDNYNFRYKADFTNFTNGATDQYIIGINFKAASGDLVGFSSPSTTANGFWSYGIDDNLSAGNQTCGDAVGNNDFFCGSLGPTPDPNIWNQNPTTGVYQWLFTLNLAGVAPAEVSSLVYLTPIRALFARFQETGNPNTPPVTGNWANSLASLTTAGPPSDSDGGSDSQVPEPATMALVGLGLALAGSRLRKRTR